VVPILLRVALRTAPEREYKEDVMQKRFTTDVVLNIAYVESKKQQFERAGFRYERELSPAEPAGRPSGLKPHQTVLQFSHPL
jgi:hypothetical protein